MIAVAAAIAYFDYKEERISCGEITERSNLRLIDLNFISPVEFPLLRETVHVTRANQISRTHHAAV